MSREATQITNKSERTLRLHAAQGKIRSRKNGKFWLFEVSAFTPRADAQVATTTVDRGRQSRPKAKSKYPTLDELGVFKDLKIIFEQARVVPSLAELSEGLQRSMALMSQGYFEFDRPRKVEKFRLCRDTLAICFIEASLLSDQTSIEIKEMIETAIIPGVSGLIRHSEGKGRQDERNRRF